jgi:hypothetical protein
MLRNLCLAVLATGAAVAAYASDVYRYVDANGGVHYSDTWVPGATLIHIEHGKTEAAPRPAPTAQAKPAQPGGNAAADLQKQANQQALQTEMTQAQGDACSKATDAYNQAIRTRRIYKSSADGSNRDYLSEDEANAYRLQLRDTMQQACGSQTK